MANAASLIAKMDKLLTKFDISDRVVYKRVITRVGGDPLLGRPAAVTTNDVSLNPQPVVKYWGFTARKEYYQSVLLADGVGQTGDVLLNPISSTCITRSELRNPDISFVLKDDTAEEEYTIVAVEPIAFQGVALAFNLLLRSKKR